MGRKDINSFDSDDITKTAKWANKFWNEMEVKSPYFRAWFGDWRRFEQHLVNCVNDNTNASSAGRVKNMDTNVPISWGNDVKKETYAHLRSQGVALKSLKSLDAMLENAIYLYSTVSTPNSKTKLEGTAFMHFYIRCIEMVMGYIY